LLLANVFNFIEWLSTGNLHGTRCAHTATVLTNGKVLVTGGTMNDVDATSSTELYDLVTGQWKSEVNMSHGRMWHTVSMLKNGNILIAAGSGLSSRNAIKRSDEDEYERLH